VLVEWEVARDTLLCLGRFPSTHTLRERLECEWDFVNLADPCFGNGLFCFGDVGWKLMNDLMNMTNGWNEWRREKGGGR
jgi:hypothetical protein